MVCVGFTERKSCDVGISDEEGDEEEECDSLFSSFVVRRNCLNLILLCWGRVTPEPDSQGSITPALAFLGGFLVIGTISSKFST